MHTGTGQVLELILEDGSRHVRVSCASTLVPAPGQYLIAGDGSNSPLPVPLFHTDSVPKGFIAAGSIPDSWNPGMGLYLRGPLGHGFSLPPSARRVGLISLDVSPARLRGLIRPALRQDAAVVLLSNSSIDHLPDEVEVQPMSALQEIIEWADFLAMDVPRENLNQLRKSLGKPVQALAGKGQAGLGRIEAQILLYTPIPCGGAAECGVCAVTLRSTWKLACKDGPVFDWSEIQE